MKNDINICKGIRIVRSCDNISDGWKLHILYIECSFN